MKGVNEEEQMLFIYQVEGKPGFLVFDGRRYCRFLVLDGKYRFVRVLQSIPAGASGCCACVTSSERKQLEQEAARAGAVISFYNNAEACLKAASEQRHGQYIFGQSEPGGYFLLDSAFQG
jgi:hypothetical protein